MLRLPAGQIPCSLRLKTSILTGVAPAETMPSKRGPEVCSWPEASVRCLAAIRPKSGVKPTCQDSSADAFDPQPDLAVGVNLHCNELREALTHSPLCARAKVGVTS